MEIPGGPCASHDGYHCTACGAPLFQPYCKRRRRNMNRITFCIAAFLLFGTQGVMAADGQPVQNPTETERIHVMHEQMLYPVVLIDTGTGGGSGTVIRSAKNETGEVETYILTNFHVIESAVKVVEEWDPIKKEDVKKETRSPVDASWFIYNQLSRSVGTVGKALDIVAYDKTLDLALLKSRDIENLVPY